MRTNRMHITESNSIRPLNKLKGKKVGGGGNKLPKYKNIVFLGASITEGAFGRDLVNPNVDATNELGIEGVNVYGYGVSGSTIASYITGANRLQQALDAFPKDTLFHIHLGGNNLSTNRPWGNTSQEYKDTTKQHYQDMLNILGDRVSDCILSPISFRDYDGLAWGDESLSSLPFNQEITLPHQNGKFSNSDGYPVTDWYGWALSNQAMMHEDGVHMSPEGYRRLRKNTMERLKVFLTGGKPAVFNHTVPFIPPHNPNSYPINFGNSPVNGNRCSYTDVVNGTSVSLLNHMRDRSKNITWSAVALDPTTGVGTTSSGGYCNIDYDFTLQSEPFYKESLFVKEGNTVTHTLSGITPNSQVVVSFVGYRELAKDRFTEIVDSSNPSNKVVFNTSTLPPQPLTELTLTADVNGEVSFVQQAGVGQAFSYLGGMLITVI